MATLFIIINWEQSKCIQIGSWEKCDKFSGMLFNNIKVNIDMFHKMDKLQKHADWNIIQHMIWFL